MILDRVNWMTLRVAVFSALAIAAPYNSIHAGSSVQAIHTDDVGDWTHAMVEIAEDTYIYTVDLNGTREFTLTFDFDETNPTARVSVGGYRGLVYLDTGHDPGGAFAYAMLEPLLDNGKISIADYFQNIEDDQLAHMQQLSDIAPAEGCWDDEFCADFGDCCCATDGMVWPNGNGVNVCNCDDNSYESCFDCCSDLFPEPYPGTGDLLWSLANCQANAMRDLCTCACTGGWFCTDRWNLNDLACWPSGIIKWLID